MSKSRIAQTVHPKYFKEVSATEVILQEISAYFPSEKKRKQSISCMTPISCEFYYNENYKLLLISYSDGFQVWNLNDLQPVKEVCFITGLKIKKANFIIFNDSLCICVFGIQLNVYSAGNSYDIQKTIKFNKPVYDIVIKENHTIAVCDAEIIILKNLQIIHRIVDFKRTHKNYDLGSRWMVYATTESPLEKPKTFHGSITNPFENDAEQEKMEESTFLGTIASTISSASQSTMKFLSEKASSKEPNLAAENSAVGFVKILDLITLQTLVHKKVNNNEISYLAFNPNGSNLFSSSIKGKSFHMYQICIAKFKLHRGITNAVVESVTFDNESKWISVNTIHGTSHLYNLCDENSLEAKKKRFGLTAKSGTKSINSIFKIKVPVNQESVMIENLLCRPIGFQSFEFPKKIADKKDRIILSFTSSTVLEMYFVPCDNSNPPMKIAEWNLQRQTAQSDFKCTIEENMKPLSKASWTSKIQVETLYPLERPIWMGPQISFQKYEDSSKGVPYDVAAFPIKIQATLPNVQKVQGFSEIVIKDNINDALDNFMDIEREVEETERDFCKGVRMINLLRRFKSNLVNIKFVTSEGQCIKLKVPSGTNILKAAHDNHVELEGACEGSLACSTCHVILPPNYYSKLKEPTDEENDMLDLAFGLTETSRLGCQVILDENMEGVEIKIPAVTRNMAVDGFKPKPH